MIASAPTQAPRRVLIVKPSALGDVATATPVLRGLRRTYPHAHLAWLVNRTCAPLIAHDSDLDEVIPFDRQGMAAPWLSPRAAHLAAALLRRLRRARFDWVVDLQGLLRSGIFTAATGASLRAGFADAREGAVMFYNRRVRASARHTVDRNIELARRLGIDARRGDLTLQVTPEAGQFAHAFLQDHNLRPGAFVACVPPARWATKQYPPRHWRRVIAALAHWRSVVLLGAPGDQHLCEATVENLDGIINMAGRTSVEQFVALIAASSGVVCCDSAAAMIAPALGVGVVVMIGPTRVERTGPYVRGRAIVADVPCRGCLKRRCSHVTCMQMIDPADVIAAAREMFVEGTNGCHTAS